MAQMDSVASYSFGRQIDKFSMDQNGFILVSFENGDITKLSPKLDSLATFSPVKMGAVSNLEAWQGLKIFSFYEPFQEYLLLDRFLSRGSRYPFTENSLSLVQTATFSGDENIWLIEGNEVRLIKYSSKDNVVLLEVPLDLIWQGNEQNIVFLKEYQNLLFAVDAVLGIFIFDNLGNYLNKIDISGLSYCSFYGDQVIFYSNDELRFLNLYDGTTQSIALNSKKMKLIGINNNKIVSFVKGSVIIQMRLVSN